MTVRYRLLAGTGEVLEEGDGSVEMAGGALVLLPAVGEVLRIAPAEIVEIGEPEPYVVRLVLAEGPVLDLSRLGAMRTQVLAELADARASGVARTLLLDGVGAPEAFPGAVDDVEAELRLYDDALVVLPVRGDAEKVPYPFVREVTTDPSGYRLSVHVPGRAPLELGRLGRRTTEFVDLLRARCTATSGRTAAFLGALLPGLGPIASRTTAALLRDGLAGSRADLDAVDPTVWPALVKAATLPERVKCVRLLESLGPVWIGFKQVGSVQRPASGTSHRQDPTVAPDLGGHGAGGSAFGPGLSGVFAAGVVAGGPPTGLGFDAPFQAMGAMLAYRMLGTGFGSGEGFGGSGFGGSGFGDQHTMLPRANVTRTPLTPATTDLGALAVSGDLPTVLAFMLCRTPGGTVLYEVLNAPDHATYAYRADPPAINRALDLIGFRVAAVYDDADSAGSPYRTAARRLPALRLLRDAYAGRAKHHGGWADRVRTLAA